MIKSSSCGNYSTIVVPHPSTIPMLNFRDRSLRIMSTVLQRLAYISRTKSASKYICGFGLPSIKPFLNGLLGLFQLIKQFRYSSGIFHQISKQGDAKDRVHIMQRVEGNVTFYNIVLAMLIRR